MVKVTVLLLGVILLVISILLILAVLDVFKVYPASDVRAPSMNATDVFDYSTLLLDPNPIDTSSYDECDKLKLALKYAILTGKPQKVDEIAYGNDLSSPVQFPFIGDCPDEEIFVTLANGLEQKVCKFLQINGNVVQGINSYGGISDNSFLYFDNCFYNNSRELIVFPQSGPDEDFDPNNRNINLYYSPDYLYLQDGDYYHPGNSINSIKNVSAFSKAYNGGGRLKIYIGKATVKNGICKFNIYFCPRTAIAKSTENSTIDVFDNFRKLEIFDLLVMPFYMRDLTESSNKMTGYERSVYYWNFYEIPLDSDYRVETIINAIKEGLYTNVFSRNYFFAHPHWDVKKETSINFNSKCWDSSFDSLINSESRYDRTRSIRFNCGNDNVCENNLGIMTAIRRDIDSDGKTFISGVISFCGD